MSLSLTTEWRFRLPALRGLTKLTFGEELYDFYCDGTFGPKGLSPLSLLLARADLTLLDRLTLELGCFSEVKFLLPCFELF